MFELELESSITRIFFYWHQVAFILLFTSQITVLNNYTLCKSIKSRNLPHIIHPLWRISEANINANSCYKIFKDDPTCEQLTGWNTQQHKGYSRWNLTSNTGRISKYFWIARRGQIICRSLLDIKINRGFGVKIKQFLCVIVSNTIVWWMSLSLRKQNFCYLQGNFSWGGL